MTAGTVHIIRHGESGWNHARKVQGQSLEAPGLTKRGVAQALVAAEQLTGLSSSATSIISSDLTRAVETAEVIGAELGLPVRKDEALREHRLGVFETKLLDDPWQDTTVSHAIEECWKDPSSRPQGGESILEMYARVHSGLRVLIESALDSDLIVVSHGGPIRALLIALRLGRPRTRPEISNGLVSSLPFKALLESPGRNLL